MDNNKKYKDRGLMKWAPFDALTSIDNVLNEIKYHKYKNEKPILSTDKMELINESIISSINNQEEVMIKYFSKGYIIEICNIIKTVDQINNKMYTLSNEIIEMNDLLDVIKL